MNLAAWRDLSIILLAIQTLLMVAVVGVVLYLLNRGMAKLRGALARFAPLAQERLWRVSHASQRLSEKAVAPIIRAETANAQVRRWFVAVRAAIRH